MHACAPSDDASGANVAILTYTGLQPSPGQALAISGFTTGACSPLNTSVAKFIFHVSTVGLTASSMEVPLTSIHYASGPPNFPLVGVTSDTGTATLYGHVYNLSHGGFNVSDTVTNYPAWGHPLSPAVTGQPGYFIFGGGANDILGCGTPSQATPSCTTPIESAIQAFWITLHNDGWTVVTTNQIMMENGGQYLTNIVPMNDWYATQVKQQSSPVGQYTDYLADVFSVLPSFNQALFGSGQTIHTNSAGSALFSAVISNAITLHNNVPNGVGINSLLLEANRWSAEQTFPAIDIYKDQWSGQDAQFATSWGSTWGDGVGIVEYLGSAYGSNIYKIKTISTGGPYSGPSGARYADIYSADSAQCWTTIYGGWMMPADPSLGLSLEFLSDGTPVLDVDDCKSSKRAANPKPMRVAGLYGPTTAPSGACTSAQAGEWVFSQDGALTRCPSGGGTWTAFSPQAKPQTFASLSTATPCTSSAEGYGPAAVTDSSTATPGATISGGGSYHVAAYCNGTAWIVL